jgi:hypothetical protein
MFRGSTDPEIKKSGKEEVEYPKKNHIPNPLQS